MTGSGPTILVVDDEVMYRTLVVGGLGAIDCRAVLEAEDGEAARAILQSQPVDIVITDVLMPRLDGIGLMKWAKEHCPGPTWIILSGVDTFDAAVEAIRLGAFDFIPKPPQLQMLEVSVRNAWEHRSLVLEKERLTRDLAERVRQLERVCLILEDQAATINQDLRRAEVIQTALLPNAPPRMEGFRVDALYRPGKNVGGDLFDVSALDERRVVIYVADAAGHGVAAAMLSVLFKQRLRPVDPETGDVRSPSVVLGDVNRAILSDVTAPGMFLTAAYGVLDTVERELTIAVAGHPAVLVLRSSGEIEAIERTGPALGLSADASFEERSIRLQPGERALLYTDGLTDGLDGGAELARLFRREDLSGRELVADLFERAASSLSDGDRDDVTIVLLEGRAGSSSFETGEVVTREEPVAEPAPAPAAAPQPVPSPTLVRGETAERTFIGIVGRGTYKHSSAFSEAAGGTVEAGRDLTLDLRECEHLDSTFLGLIHDVVSRASAAGSDVSIEGVGDAVRGLFEELSMDLVLDRTRSEPTAPEARPEMEPLGGAGAEVMSSRVMLRAHEILLSLSESNRERFQAVVDAMRAELGEEAAGKQ